MDYSAVSGGLELEFYNDIKSGTAEDYDITGGEDVTEGFLERFAGYVGGDLSDDDDDESSSAEFVQAEPIEGGLENSDEEELVVPKEPELEQQEEEVEVVEVKNIKKKKKDEEDKEDKEEEDDEVIVPVENSDSELPEDVYVDQQFIEQNVEQNVEGGQLEDNFAGEENNYAEQDVELENNFDEVEGGEKDKFAELNAILRGNY
jgi:hypothetical protein